MTLPLSAASALQDAILTAIAGRATDPASPLHVATGREQTGQVPIDLGTPAQIQPEHVWIRDEVAIDRIPEVTGGTGATFLSEFRVEVVIQVTASGDDATVTRERMELLANDVETLLDAATFPQVGGLLDGWVENATTSTGIDTGARTSQTVLRFFGRSYPA